MNYTFFIETISNSKYFCIKTNDPKYSSLGRFSDDDWTVTKIQNFINGINNGKSKPKGQEYIWANEDLTVLCNIHGVF